MFAKGDRYIEPLLIDNISKYCQLPVKFPEFQAAYDAHEAMFWTAKEIDYSADLKDWNDLKDEERYFIEHILAFFAGSDGIVLENLLSNFSVEVKATEVRNFYAFQGAIENIHGMVYALLIDTFIKDRKRKDELFNAIEKIPCVKKKADWAIKWMNTEKHFEERIIAFAAIEGIFFSSSFASIFWLKSRGKMTKALGKSNELISRDESLHTMFAVLIYKHLRNKVSKEVVESIIKEAVDIETEFITESIPCSMIGMNTTLMSQYIKYVADRLLVQLDFDKIYNVENPFDFMKNFSLDGKSNFFEQKVSEYKHASTAQITEENYCFDEDF